MKGKPSDRGENRFSDRIQRKMNEMREEEEMESLLDVEGVDLDARLAETDLEIERGEVQSTPEMLASARTIIKSHLKQQGRGPAIG